MNEWVQYIGGKLRVRLPGSGLDGMNWYMNDLTMSVFMAGRTLEMSTYEVEKRLGERTQP
jgi:hypothetical protein